MAVRPVVVQRRMMELGRVRLGQRGSKGEPRKLDTFRLTSASRALLEAVAARYGGKVTAWDDPDHDGYFQVITEATELDIILPPVFSQADGTPTAPYSQWFELWSGGGCIRRCDAVTEALSGKPCICNPENRECQITTRVSFMLPDIPGLGVWRLDSKGWNAAAELPGTLEVLLMAAAESRFIPAVLRMIHRTKKEPGQPIKKFVVPVIDLPQVTVRDLANGTAPSAINPPTSPPRERPALPTAGADLPDDPRFATPEPQPGWGEEPELGPGMVSEENSEPADPPHETPGPANNEIPVLTIRLVELAQKLGNEDVTRNAIGKNRIAHQGNPNSHRDWLKTQVEKMEQAVAELESTQSEMFPTPTTARGRGKTS